MKTTLKIVATLGLLLGLWGVANVFAQSETGRPFITKWQGTAGKALAIPIFGKEYKLVIKNEKGEEVKREEKLIVENLMDPYTFTPNTDGIYTIEAGPEGVKFM